MSGRNYLPPDALKLRETPLARAPPRGHPALIDDPRVPHRGVVPPASGSGRPHPALVEERIAAQHREMQLLLGDNQRLAATDVALKQELSVTDQELRHLLNVAADVKADRDAQVREIHERSLKMEAEVRSIDAFSAELAQVRADVQKLSDARKELAAKLKDIDGELVSIRPELQQLSAIRAEIEVIHQEIQRGRDAIEYEKKARASNLEQGQAMEKHLISMTREIEKLHAELANAEKRARAAAAAANPGPGYAAGFGNHETGYGGGSYPDRYAMQQAQGNTNAGPQYGSATAPHGLYDMQLSHAHR